MLTANLRSVALGFPSVEKCPLLFRRAIVAFVGMDELNLIEFSIDGEEPEEAIELGAAERVGHSISLDV